MLEKLSPLFKSRRFWVVVGGIIVATTNVFGLDLDPSQVNHVVLLSGAWIVGDSLRTV